MKEQNVVEFEIVEVEEKLDFEACCQGTTVRVEVSIPLWF